MKNIIHTIFEILFPRSDQEKAIHALSSNDLIQEISVRTDNNITSLFSYRDPLIRALIWQIKYKRNTHAACILADALQHALREIVSETSAVLIPIPLSKKRMRERGYNQVTLILKNLHLDTISTQPQLLVKKVHTVSQTSLHRNERLTNLTNAFAVASHPDPNVHYVIIDDVTTTGATLHEAARSLTAAGATRITCIALAH